MNNTKSFKKTLNSIVDNNIYGRYIYCFEKKTQKYFVMNRIRTCEGKSHWISSPTP